MRPALVAAIVLTAVATAEGGWSVRREGDVWWLRTPDGARFYSRGVDTVEGGAGELRRPDRPGFYWQDHFATVEDFRRWARDGLVRWGFDTRGGWSDPAPSMALPYVVELDLGRTAQLHWFDLFAPDAAGNTVAAARRLTAPYRGDPLLIGYFTDNEVGWWNSPLFGWYLRARWENHTKRVLWRLVVDH